MCTRKRVPNVFLEVLNDLQLRPCILNFILNFRVSFWVGRSFSRFLKFDFPNFLTQKQGFVTQKQIIISKLFFRVQKDHVFHVFPKKIPSNVGPYLQRLILTKVEFMAFDLVI